MPIFEGTFKKERKKKKKKIIYHEDFVRDSHVGEAISASSGIAQSAQLQHAFALHHANIVARNIPRRQQQLYFSLSVINGYFTEVL